MKEDIAQPPGEVTFDVSWKTEDLKRQLKALRRTREAIQRESLKLKRKSLNQEERANILAKTGGRCHICGGQINPEFYWEADHVLRHCVGGANSLENYLAAHGLCNMYRWDHLPEEMQWILKIGVWARRQMEQDSELGGKMLDGFFKYEMSREKRKKPRQVPPCAVPPSQITEAESTA